MRAVLDAYHALGTAWWLEIPDAIEHARAVMIKEMVVTYITDFEQTYSRFIEDSLVTQLNTQRVLHDAPDDFIDMLQRGMRYEHMTDGVFSLCVGGVLERRGYGRAGTHTQADEYVPRCSDSVDISHHTIRLAGSAHIDLGGIGKAYAIERIARMIEDCGVHQYVINGGGDIVVESAESIEIDIEHPTRTDISIATIPMYSGALCTSSPFKRVWNYDSQQYTHLVHPQHLEMGVQDLRESATVYARSIVDADVFATVCAILGSTCWEEIQRFAYLFHADILMCSIDGVVHASPSLQKSIHSQL